VIVREHPRSDQLAAHCNPNTVAMRCGPAHRELRCRPAMSKRGLHRATQTPTAEVGGWGSTSRSLTSRLACPTQTLRRSGKGLHRDLRCTGLHRPCRRLHTTAAGLRRPCRVGGRPLSRSPGPVRRRVQQIEELPCLRSGERRPLGGLAPEMWTPTHCRSGHRSDLQGRRGGRTRTLSGGPSPVRRRVLLIEELLCPYSVERPCWAVTGLRDSDSRLKAGSHVRADPPHRSRTPV
jgi:hypothetical protein